MSLRSEFKHEPTLSPRKLHKAASTTFQAFSDSLRSRAQAFYVSSGQADAGPSDTPEPKTPKKSSRRSARWPSVRNRGACSSHTDKPTSELGPETPPQEELSPIGPAPQLDLDIPSSSLRDPQAEDDVTTPPVTPERQATRRLTPIPTTTQGYGHRQLWPSPHMQLRNLSLARGASHAAGTTKIPDAQYQASVADKGDAPARRCESPATESPGEIFASVVENNNNAVTSERPRTNRFIEDTGYVSDTESNNGTLATNASTARTSISRPPSLTKVLNDPNRICNNASQSNEDFRGTFWPASKVIKNMKRSSRSSTNIGDAALTAETSNERINLPTDSLIATSEPHPPAGPHHQEQFSEGTNATTKPEAASVLSEAYEADNEAVASSPLTVSMGPRAAWDDARAERNKRYAALHLGVADVDTSTDEDSDFGVELTISPSLPCVRRPYKDVDELATLSHGMCQLPQHGQQIPFSRRVLETNTSSAPRQQESKMQELSHIEHPISASPEPCETPLIPIDLYLGDKSLRHKLLDTNADFALGETLNGEDASAPEDRFLVTSRLDPRDPLDAALARFGHPNLTLHKPFLSNTDFIATKDCFRSDSPDSDLTTDSCAITTHDPACFVPPPYPALHLRSRPVRQVSGLINEVRRELDPKQDLEDVDDDAETAEKETMAAFPKSLEDNRCKDPQSSGIFNREVWKATLPFRGGSSTLPKVRTKSPTCQDSSSSRVSAVYSGFGGQNENKLSRKDSVHSANNLSMSETAAAETSNSRRVLGRGRCHGSSCAVQRRNARTLGQLPSRGDVKLTSIKRCASMSSLSTNQGSTASRASSYSFDIGFDEAQWLKESYRRPEQQIVEDSEKGYRRPEEGRRQEPRLRLADISMVKRREELQKRAVYNGLCRFVYKCEEESEAEVSSEGQEEDEDGYTAAMFQGK
ncbi:MAG: hypothetical protein LQ338_004127 [Usnochroma carphineum]|nr:MAG: hypothetical protein LQ338_004127 [Usnochroma carphineum]